MNEFEICDMVCTLKEVRGVSKKTGKPYTMKKIVVHTEMYGDVEILLDTRADRAGIVLDMIRKENA